MGLDLHAGMAGPRSLEEPTSYTIAQTKPDPQLRAGFGDVLLNYRYQVVGTGESRLALAPRLTLIVPTGSSRNGTGYGGTGIQSNLPGSLVLSRTLVAHSNLGGTWIPSARDRAGDAAASYGYFAGQSIVWLALDRMGSSMKSSKYLVRRMLSISHSAFLVSFCRV